MTPKAMQTIKVVRVLFTVWAVGLQLSMPSTGTPADSLNAQPGVSSELPAAASSQDASIATPARMLTGIDVQRDLDDLKVVISGDGRLAHEAKLVSGRRLVVDIPHVTSSIRKPTLPVNHPLLEKIRLGNYADKVRVVFDLNAKAGFSVEPQGVALIVSVKNSQDDRFSEANDSSSPAAAALSADAEASDAAIELAGVRGDFRATPSRPRRIPASFQIRPAQMMVGSEATEKHTPKDDLVLGETRYVGRRISLDFQQADISNVLRLIAEVSGFNIVVGEGVKSKVTMKLVSVPWDQALDMILKMNGLGKIKQGNILWIDSLANIARQEDEEARAKDAKTKAEELVDRVFYVRNLQAQELLTALRQNLSARGVMQISQGTNALIVRDTESKMNVLKQLIDGLDLAVPQVQIEARIVQADTTYSRSLGVQWGVQNLNQGSSFGVANFKSGTTGSFGNQTSDFLVNLPAAVGGLVSTPGAGFTFGRADGALLDVRLSAGELLGLSKVIAAPKVTTLDKREAKISQGESIPFQTTSL